MSLDISLMDESGRPSVQVSLSVSEHRTLLEQAQQLQLPLWSRMREFYSDADYEENEVGTLLNETVSLRQAQPGLALSDKLIEVEKLLRAAIDGKKRICAIAD